MVSKTMSERLDLLEESRPCVVSREQLVTMMAHYLEQHAPGAHEALVDGSTEDTWHKWARPLYEAEMRLRGKA